MSPLPRRFSAPVWSRIVLESTCDETVNAILEGMFAFTTPVIYSMLGKDYQFKTQVYKRGNDAYLKLSADPTLTTRNLRHLIRAYRRYDLKQPDKFYIDDSIVDNQEYGIGWQWDDEVSPLIPKNSSYNIDGNIYALTITPSNDKKSVKITQPPVYNVGIINKLKVGKTNKIFVQRNFWEGVEKVTLYGTVSTPTTVQVSTYNQKRYFSYHYMQFQNFQYTKDLQYLCYCQQTATAYIFFLQDHHLQFLSYF